MTIAVVLLLITNIGLVAFMVFGRHGKGPERRRERGEPSEWMIKEMKMTGEQQKQFKAMKEAHFQAMKPIFDSIRAEKSALVDLLKEKEVSDSLFNAYNHRILEKQNRIDLMTFQHFRKVRGIFNADQQPKFDEFLKKMITRRRDSVDRK